MKKRKTKQSYLTKSRVHFDSLSPSFFSFHFLLDENWLNIESVDVVKYGFFPLPEEKVQ